MKGSGPLGQISPSVALGCSLLLHAGAFVALRQAPPTTLDARSQSILGDEDAPFVLLPTAPPEPQTQPQPQTAPRMPDSEAPAPEATLERPPAALRPPVPQPTLARTVEPPNPLRPVELGQADGTPGSTDWIASNASGLHSAMLATDQAGLTRTPGASRPPSASAPPAAPPETAASEQPDAAPAEAAAASRDQSAPAPTPPAASMTPASDTATRPAERASAGPEVDTRASTDPTAAPPSPQSVPDSKFPSDHSPAASSDTPEAPAASSPLPALVPLPTSPPEPSSRPDQPTAGNPQPGTGDRSTAAPVPASMPPNPDASTIGPESIRSAGEQQPTPPLPGPGPTAAEPSPRPTTVEPPSAPIAPPPPPPASTPASPESRPAATLGTEPTPGLATTTPDLILTPSLTGTPRPAQPAGRPAAAPPTSASPPSPSPAATPSTPNGPQGNAGAQSDREVDPTSAIRRGEFRNGRVNVGRGLELRPLQRPEFSLLARTLASPASPIVEIHIRKSGQIADVKIIRSSGYPAEIDEPIRNAIFFWRASGPELSGLSDDPDARFVVRLTFNLR